MATIKRVELQNWKGLTRSVTLGARTLLIGANATGKTALIQAIEYAVLGHTRLGRTLDANAQLVGVTGGSAGVALDNGFTCERSIERNTRTGANSGTVTVSGDSKNPEADIREQVGDFAGCFSLDEFLALSPDKRREYLLRLCESAGGGAEGLGLVEHVLLGLLIQKLGQGAVETWCRAELGVGIEGLTLEQVAQTRARLWPNLDAAWKEAWPTIFAALEKCLTDDPVETLSAMLAEAKSLKSASKKAKEQAQQAARKLSDEKACIEVAAGTAPELEAELAKVREDIAKVREQASEQSGQSQARDNLKDQIANLKANLNAAKKKKAAMQASEPVGCTAPEDLQKEAAKLRAEAEKIDLNWDTQNKLGDERAEKDAEVRNCQAAMSKITNEITRLDAEHNRLNAEVAALADDPWEKAQQLADKVQMLLDTQELDPHEVGGLGDAWGDLYVHIENQCEHHRDIGKVRAEIDAAQQKITAQRAEWRELQAMLTALTGEQNQLRDEHVKAVRDAETLRKKQEDFLRQARAKDEAANQANNARIGYLEELGEQRARIAALEKQVAESEARRSEVDKGLGGAEVDAETLKAQRDALEKREKVLCEQLGKKRAFAVLDEKLVKCVADAEREAVAFDVADATMIVLKRVREGLMGSMVNPLIDAMNEFFVAAGVDRKAYCRLESSRGKALFEIGWLADGRAVSLPALSGGESALFLAALAYALVKQADCPVSILALEADALDGPNKARLIHALTNCDIDTVIVACHTALATVPDGWTQKLLALPEKELVGV